MVRREWKEEEKEHSKRNDGGERNEDAVDLAQSLEDVAVVEEHLNSSVWSDPQSRREEKTRDEREVAE